MGNVEAEGITTVSTESAVQVPSSFALHQNYPNPFNPVTTIPFDLSEEGMVEFTICAILGRRVAVVLRERMVPGQYQQLVDMRRFASGMYLYELRVLDESREQCRDVGKLILIK